MTRRCFRLLGVLGLLLAGAAGADEGTGFSGSLSLEGGGLQAPAAAVQTYSYYRLFLRDLGDLDQGLSYGLAAEADWQTLAPPGSVAWPLYPQSNAVRLEADNAATSGGNDFYGIEMDRAYLRWASGPLEVTAGLFKPSWGSARFYHPTDYFFPLPPLQWERSEPLASEGLDASYFLFDDFSLEGAARWLSGGNTEGVVRLVNKGIGLTVIPSAAWLTGRNAFGLEVAGTFPTFQVRLEGTDWLYSAQRTAADWVAGLSTSNRGVEYTAEVLRDQTGEILGAYSNVGEQATYVFLTASGGILDRWKASPSLVVPLEGGPFLFWPKLVWDFAPQWELGAQAQVLLGDWQGPLDLYPGRAGASLDYSF